eukprot:gene15417-12621_t
MIQIITVAALFGLAGNAYGAAAGYCDGRLAASTEWCMLNERIPCHDLTCQIPAKDAPQKTCPTGASVTACALHAAPLCSSAPNCVAFGILSDRTPHWIEWYNSTATSNPLESPDWTYFFNTTALGPAPQPAPTCVPGIAAS